MGVDLRDDPLQFPDTHLAQTSKMIKKLLEILLEKVNTDGIQPAAPSSKKGVATSKGSQAASKGSQAPSRAQYYGKLEGLELAFEHEHGRKPRSDGNPPICLSNQDNLSCSQSSPMPGIATWPGPLVGMRGPGITTGAKRAMPCHVVNVRDL